MIGDQRELYRGTDLYTDTEQLQKSINDLDSKNFILLVISKVLKYICRYPRYRRKATKLKTFLTVFGTDLL